MSRHKMSPSIDLIAEECVAVRLRMLNRVVTNIYDEALRPLEMKVSQMNILVATAKLGTVRPTKLGEILHLDPSTLSRNLDRMVFRGWLEVVHDDRDGRSQPVRLTAEGRTVLDQAADCWQSAQDKVRELLGPMVIEQLCVATRKLAQVATE